jgi:hypothetical protein
MIGKRHYVDVGLGMRLDNVQVDGRGHGPTAGTESADHQTFLNLREFGSYSGNSVEYRIA